MGKERFGCTNRRTGEHLSDVDEVGLHDRLAMVIGRTGQVDEVELIF